jgi:hypothetical protein
MTWLPAAGKTSKGKRTAREEASSISEVEDAAPTWRNSGGERKVRRGIPEPPRLPGIRSGEYLEGPKAGEGAKKPTRSPSPAGRVL